MIIGRKSIIYTAGVVLGLAIIILAVRVISGNSYRNKIPTLPDFRNMSKPLQEQLSQVYSKAYKKPNAANLGMLGMVYHSGAFYDKAAICYDLASEKDRGKWIWHYYNGYLNQEMGDPKAAIKNYREVIKKNPDLFLAWYYEGECYQKIGISDSAELAFKHITSRMDKNAVVKSRVRYDYFPLVTFAMHNLAKIYINTARIDTAEKTLLKIIDYQRAFGPAYRLLGNVYSIRGNEPLSKRYLVRANDLTVSPDPVDTLIDRLSLMSRSDMYLLKRIDEAEKSVYPEYALELVNHSLTYIPENNYLVAKAIKLFLIRDLGKQALPYLNQHINYFKNDFDELKNVGDLLYNKGFYTQAMNYYSSAINLKPSDNQVQSCIVICLSREGKKEQALSMENQILEENRTNPSVLADGVTLLLNLGEKDKAVMWLLHLKKISPSFTKGQQLTGMLAEQDSNWKQALSSYSSAFNSDPSDLTTVRLLGNLLIRQKLWKRAIAHYRKALESHPNDPYILERLGTLLVTCSDSGLRDISQGKDLCERAFIHTASHSITLISAGRSLAIAYALLGDNRNASNVIKMTINLARGENVPASYVDDLRNLLQKFSSSN
jgi:tetratricopeptide (TPR) repeat protein